MALGGVGASAGVVWIDVLPRTSKFGPALAAQTKTATAALGASMAKTGAMLTKRLTLPIVAAGGASVKMASDFNKTMSKIRGLVGASEKQVGKFHDQVLALSRDLPQSPNELAEALFFVTSAGFEGAEAMEVLNKAARAAAGGLGDTQTVADAVTSAVNAYGADALSAGEATDILAAAVREGKAEADSFAPVLGRIIPVAAEMGVSFDQVAAAVAAMTRSGASAAEATTSLRGILTTLLKPSKDTKETWKDMGLSLDSVRATLEEDGLLHVLEMMRDEVGNNNEAWGKLFPNVRGLSGVLSLVGKNAEANAEIFGDLADATGAADHAFAAASETFDFKFRAALSALQATAIQVGEKLLPHVEKLVSFIGDLADKFGNLSDSTQETVVKVALLAAALGPVLFIVGKLLGPIGLLGKAVLGLGTASRAAAGVKGLGALKANLAATGTLLAPGGVLLVGAGLAAAAFISARREAEKWAQVQGDWNTEMLEGKSSLELHNELVAELTEQYGDAAAEAMELLNFEEKFSGAVADTASELGAQLAIAKDVPGAIDDHTHALILNLAKQGNFATALKIIQENMKRATEEIDQNNAANNEQERQSENSRRALEKHNQRVEEGRRKTEDYTDAIKRIPSKQQTQFILDTTAARAEMDKMLQKAKDNSMAFLVSDKPTAHSGGLMPQQLGRGSDGSSTDEFMAILKRGEFVVRPEATKKNLNLLRAINAGQDIPDFHVGGLVGMDNLSGDVDKYRDLIRSMNRLYAELAPNLQWLVPPGMGSEGTPSIRRIVGATMAMFPGQINSLGIKNIRNIAGTNILSQHSFGNAWDWMAKGGMAAMDRMVAWQRSAGLPIRQILWRVRDHYDHAHTEGEPKYGGNPYTGGYPMDKGGILRVRGPATVQARVGAGVTEDVSFRPHRAGGGGPLTIKGTFRITNWQQGLAEFRGVAVDVAEDVYDYERSYEERR